MLNFKRVSCLSLLYTIALLAISSNTYAIQTSLDLHGDGKLTKINIPFKYFQQQPDDNFTLIHELFYKIYDIKDSEHEVVVLGPLRPCIAIVVTDGKRLVAFHKHSSNALDVDLQGSLQQTLQKNLDLNPNNEFLRARIYTTKDVVRWVEMERSELHKGKTLDEAIEDVRVALEAVGIPSDHIMVDQWNLRVPPKNEYLYEHSYLGNYGNAMEFVAIRIIDLYDKHNNIKFFSIDPYNEDIFGFKKVKTTFPDFYGKDRFSAICKLTERQIKDKDLKVDKSIAELARKCREGVINKYDMLDYASIKEHLGILGIDYIGVYQRKVREQYDCLSKNESPHSQEYNTRPFYLMDATKNLLCSPLPQMFKARLDNSLIDYDLL